MAQNKKAAKKSKKASPKKAAKLKTVKSKTGKAKPAGLKAKPATTKAKAKTAPRLKIVRSETSWSNFLTPLDDRLLVEVQTTTTTAGGLIVPSSIQQRPQNGKVLAVGRGHRDSKGRIRPMDVRPGDRILFAEHAGTSLRLENSDVIILREEDVLGVLG